MMRSQPLVHFIPQKVHQHVASCVCSTRRHLREQAPRTNILVDSLAGAVRDASAKTILPKNRHVTGLQNWTRTRSTLDAASAQTNSQTWQHALKRSYFSTWTLTDLRPHVRGTARRNGLSGADRALAGGNGHCHRQLCAQNAPARREHATPDRVSCHSQPRGE
jgi:hypothetical protein